MRARLQIFESDLDEIKSLSKIYNFRFVSYVIANVCVLEHVICVVSWFSSAKHFEKKKKKGKKKRRNRRFWFLEDRKDHEKQRKTRFRQSTRIREKREELKEKEKRNKIKKREEKRWWKWIKRKEKKKMIKMNEKKKKMI